MARSTYIYHVYDLACYDKVSDVQIPHIRPFTVKWEAKQYARKRAGKDNINSRFRCIRYKDGLDEPPIEIEL